MTILSALILFGAAILGGTLNAVAGGGSFITFPSLFFTGVPAIEANTTSTVALWPGSIASISAYRRELAKQNRVLLLVLAGTSLVGGIVGAKLLLGTSQATFVMLVPYLLLLATVLFTFSPTINNLLKKRKTAAKPEITSEERRISWRALVGIAFVQLIIAIYGGYFGGGIGIMMLASLGLMGMENIHEMNALKTVLQACINGVAVIAFIVAGAVVWLQAVIMIAGAMVGGFGGAYYARKLDPRIIRGFVILVGISLTIYFFLKPK